MSFLDIAVMIVVLWRGNSMRGIKQSSIGVIKSSLAIVLGVLLGGVLSNYAYAGQISASNKHTAVSINPAMLNVEIGNLGKTVHKVVARSYPFSPDGMMFLNGEPERLVCSFDSDKLSKYALYEERKIIVYPIERYRKLFTKAEQLNEFDKRVAFLKSAIKTGKVGAGDIGVLPSVDACQLFRAKVKIMEFKSGKGIRFITRYSTDVSPTESDDIFYTFQGMTDDQKYWVSVFYPLKADGLKATTDGKKTQILLDSRSSNQYLPDLSKLDAMVSSISIKSPE